ncbi:hypothetical protein FPRO06_06589 [Fusarium proliferatum]|nr:hypothetical protein FPRO06_06589 [Fusarium proliferatum]
MPPKQSSGTGRGRAKATTKKGAKASEPESEPQSSNPFELSDDDNDRHGNSTREEQAVEEEEPDKSIPPELLTRLLHEFFTKDATRISRDANAAAGKYFDVFVREAIARAAVEKDGGFLEVEDLEKVSPQLACGGYAGQRLPMLRFDDNTAAKTLIFESSLTEHDAFHYA